MSEGEEKTLGFSYAFWLTMLALILGAVVGPPLRPVEGMILWVVLRIGFKIKALG
jgi:hypothetical protein